MADSERIDFVNENITLIQKTDGLTFGTDAYLLYAYMKKRPRALAADLGAGTGIISLLCAAKGKFREISTFEIQKDFAELVERNAQVNKLSDRISSYCLSVQDIDSSFAGKFDVVFSNPPYMKKESGLRNESEIKYIARHEVCGDIYDFCNAASRMLKFSGSFYVVWRPDRLADLFDAMKGARIEPKRMTLVCPSACSRPSLVLVEGKRGGASGLFVTKTLVMYSEASGNAPEYTEDLNFIYENGEFGEEYERS